MFGQICLKKVFLLALCTIVLGMQPKKANKTSYKGDEKFPVSSIPLELMLGADAVVRLNNITFTVENLKSTKEQVHYAVTIFNSKGREEAGVFYEFYDKLRKITKFKGWLRDAEGKIIRELKKSDIKDYPANSGYSLYDDYRVRIGELYHDTYPYTIEYKYEIKYKGSYSWPSWNPQLTSYAVEYSRFDIKAPKDMNIRYRTHGITFEPKVSYKNKLKILTWEVSNQKKFIPEPLGPYSQLPAVITAPTQFELDGYEGDMSSWLSLGEWGYKLNEGRDILPSESKAYVQDIIQGENNKKQKIKKIYEHLQKTTRYVSIQLGIGGLQTYDASYVSERNYGDCKALTNYMMSMLKIADITSYAAWISNGRRSRKAIPDFPSDPFNHVILFVPLDSDTLWLECTSQTNPFGHIGAGNENRYALVLKPSGGDLIRTPQSQWEDNRQVRHAYVDISATGSALTKVNMTYTGNQQDHISGALAQSSNRDRENWLRKTIDVPNFRIIKTDFANTNNKQKEVLLSYTIDVPHYASKTGSRLFLTPNIMEKWTSIPPEVEKRTQPVHLSYAYADVDSISYRLPEGYVIEAGMKPVSVNTDFGSYHASVDMKENGTLIYSRKLKITKTKLPPERYNDYREFIKQIVQADRSQIVFVKQN